MRGDDDFAVWGIFRRDADDDVAGCGVILGNEQPRICGHDGCMYERAGS
jgi:hypothetical protein